MKTIVIHNAKDLRIEDDVVDPFAALIFFLMNLLPVLQ